MTNVEEVYREGNKRGGPTKEADAITDITSTGRKRAAVMYPLEQDMLCEWAGLKAAGGGVYPIIGCAPELRNTARARHHGPDKNTVNNEPGNVHRICHHCHNRWHTLNDPTYPGQRPGTSAWVPNDSHPHDPLTKATADEIVQNELMWATKKTKKAHD